MKATGVVRRIDDLGRIVIPIEIRRSMRIRDGDPLEIFVDQEGEVILKKYSAIADLGRLAQEVAESLHEGSGYPCLIADRDQVVSVSGLPPREVLGRSVGSVVLRAMNERSTLTFRGDAHHEGPLLGEEEDGKCPFRSEVIAPIIVAGDPAGAVILGTTDDGEVLGDLEIKMAETAAGFLARHMET